MFYESVSTKITSCLMDFLTDYVIGRNIAQVTMGAIVWNYHSLHSEMCLF